jgi:hypothetical protein
MWPCCTGVGAEHRPQQLAATGAEQAGDADDLAGAHLEVDRLGRARRLEAGELQARRADLTLRVRIEVLDLAAHHRGDQVVVVELVHARRAGELAVAQDRHPVADLEHLLEVVGDVHDGVALVAEAVDAGEQRLGLRFGERRRRLVEDQHSRVLAEHLGDLDELADGQRCLLDRRVRVEPVEPDALEHRARLLAQRAGAGDAATGGQAAHQQVLADTQVRQQAELLVDDADAGVARLGRAGVAHLAALDRVGPAVALDGAGEDLDQRALAGAVLTCDAVHLAGTQLERDALERLDRPVALGDALEGDDDLVGHHCASAVGGVRSCLTSGVSMLSRSASTAPGSSLRGGTLPTVAIAASITPW